MGYRRFGASYVLTFFHSYTDMRLLIVTQKIDAHDAVLGFMHGWVAEFARQAEQVTVICLQKGEVNLPENVRVFSLGKEKTELRITNYELWKRVKYSWRFVRYIIRTRHEYGAVFVHMNPEYVVLGGIFWKFFGKKVTLWYAHKSLPWHLRVALLFTDIVFTSTKSGFRLPSKKVKVIGQGIDTNRFKIPARTTVQSGRQDLRFKQEEKRFKIVSVGRITPAKDYDTLIEAIGIACEKISEPFSVSIIGPTSLSSDVVYLERLKEKVQEKKLTGIVEFVGPVANRDLPEVLAGFDLFVNMGHTGSMDKAVPEAMASGLPVLTCNEAFKDVLGPFTDDLMYSKGDAKALAEKIVTIIKMAETERKKVGEALREIVIRDHSLESFVTKIISTIHSL